MSLNVFADLGFDDPELELAKARLVTELDLVLQAQSLTLGAAARQLGLSVKELRALLHGQWEDYSLERLNGLLHALAATNPAAPVTA